MAGSCNASRCRSRASAAIRAARAALLAGAVACERPEPTPAPETVTLAFDGQLNSWVERNVLPYFDHVPVGLVSPRLSRQDAAVELAQYLAADPRPIIVADWPEDIAQFCNLLLTGPGDMVAVPPLSFDFVPLQGFSTAGSSAVPHNALHDARALRDHVLSLE